MLRISNAFSPGGRLGGTIRVSAAPFFYCSYSTQFRITLLKIADLCSLWWLPDYIWQTPLAQFKALIAQPLACAVACLVKVAKTSPKVGAKSDSETHPGEKATVCNSVQRSRAGALAGGGRGSVLASVQMPGTNSRPHNSMCTGARTFFRGSHVSRASVLTATNP